MNGEEGGTVKNVGAMKKLGTVKKVMAVKRVGNHNRRDRICYVYNIMRQHADSVHSILRRVLDIYCQIDSSQCLAQLTTARVGKARSVHVQLGASPHVIR